MYAPSTVSLFLVIASVLALVQGIRLWRNITKARATGLRVVVTPLLETQVLAQLASPFLRAFYLTHLDAGKGWIHDQRLVVGGQEDHTRTIRRYIHLRLP